MVTKVALATGPGASPSWGGPSAEHEKGSCRKTIIKGPATGVKGPKGQWEGPQLGVIVSCIWALKVLVGLHFHLMAPFTIRLKLVKNVKPPSLGTILLYTNPILI